MENSDMKKIYVKPAMQVVKVKSGRHLLSDSLKTLSNVGLKGAKSGSSGYARSRNLEWIDEWEDE